MTIDILNEASIAPVHGPAEAASERSDVSFQLVVDSTDTGKSFNSVSTTGEVASSEVANRSRAGNSETNDCEERGWLCDAGERI